MLLLALVLTQCDDDNGFEPLSFTYQVMYPEGYTKAQAEGAEVTLTNNETDETQSEQSDENGLVTFDEVVPGSYDIEVELELDSDRALELTGTAESITLQYFDSSVDLEQESDSPMSLQLSGSEVGSLVFKEVYYTGSETEDEGVYFNDQFHEIYNNSNETLYADGLYLADVYGVSGQINPGSEPTPFQGDEDHVYLSTVWQFPGGGQDYPIEPGESIIVAQTAQDHQSNPDLNPNSPVDLGDADFETYVEREDDRDINNPDVTNMVRKYYNAGFTWLVPVFGPGLVLFEADSFDELNMEPVPGQDPEYPDRVQLPVEYVVDSFEALQNEDSGDFMRIPSTLNSGFISADGTYTSQSARRTVVDEVEGRKILQNTNNTGNDFEIIDTPTPGSFD